MLLKLTISDARGVVRGSAQLWLEWGTINEWYLEKEAPDGIWERVGFTPGGTFEPQPSNIIWLWDKPHTHNTVIFWDAPSGKTQIKTNSGQARIFDPKDPSFKEGKIRWTIDPFGLLSGPPIGSGLRNPDVEERSIITHAEQRRKIVLETAVPKLEAVISSYRAKNTAAVKALDRALLKLNIFGDRLDPATEAGQNCIPALEKALELFKANRDTPPAPPVISVGPCQTGLYAQAADFRDPRSPMLICPVFFDARPECQAFVLMHEYFHLVGVIGHGQSGWGDTRPDWALGDPSSLVHFAWRLAWGSSPVCDERSILKPLPLVHGGVVV